jgi:protein TonB
MGSLKNPKADLKKLYRRAFEISLVISLIATIAAFKLSPDASQINIINPDKPDLITVEDIINTVQKPDIPLPPKAPEIIAATVDDVPDDIILDDIDEIKDVKLPKNPPPKPKIDLSDEEYIPVPEELPSPIGGLKTLQGKVHYTEIARRAGVEGTVYIEAKINKDGNVVDAIIKKGLGAGLDDEALNAVLSTKFHPGKQRGRPVNVKMVIPIKFVLR